VIYSDADKSSATGHSASPRRSSVRNVSNSIPPALSVRAPGPLPQPGRPWLPRGCRAASLTAARYSISPYRQRDLFV